MATPGWGAKSAAKAAHMMEGAVDGVNTAFNDKVWRGTPPPWLQRVIDGIVRKPMGIPDPMSWPVRDASDIANDLVDRTQQYGAAPQAPAAPPPRPAHINRGELTEQQQQRRDYLTSHQGAARAAMEKGEGQFRAVPQAAAAEGEELTDRQATRRKYLSRHPRATQNAMLKGEGKFRVPNKVVRR